jgi:signal transduction histidine kinase/NO-binding membrane sensor protein with MHYT domain/CheY-like chemotaxis protein
MLTEGGQHVLKTIYCNPLAYDVTGLGLAIAICFFVSLLACELLRRAGTSKGRSRAMWLWGIAITAGTGFWSTHFIALLAYRPGLQTGYDPILTVLAWLATILGTGISLCILVNGTTWRARIAGGAALGLAQSVTHYVGIAAFRTEGVLVWSPLTAILAYLAPVVILGGGMIFFKRLATRWTRARGAALLTFSALIMHFWGMAAMNIRPDSGVAMSAGLIPPQGLAMALVMILVLSISMSVMALLVRESGDVEALHRLREVIDAMPAGLAYYDHRDRMVVCNSRYAEMVGLADGEIKPGVHFVDILKWRAASGQHPEAIGREADWIEERLALRRTPGQAFEQLNLGNWLRIVERSTRDGGIICVSLDVTDLKHNAERLARALKEADLANRAKDEFLTNVSHEVRTPLNGVLGLADALSKTALTSTQREVIGALQASAGALSNTMSSVIDFVSLNTGRFEIHEAPFDLQIMLSEALDFFAAPAQAKGLTLSCTNHTDPTLHPIGDRTRIQQVLVSLLDNAVKFTAQGCVTVEMDRVEQNDASLLVITVTDTGIGFDSNTADALFKTFVQADGSVTRQFGGTGLGLSVSQKLTQLMSGDLTARSMPGHGSSFRVALPIDWAASPKRVACTPSILIRHAQTPHGASAAEPQKLRVLLADDHPTNRQVVQLIMGTVEAEITAVENGAEAVDAFKLSPYDIILMDLQMPVMDGLTAMQLIRTWEIDRSMRRTPMIALTANVLPKHVSESLAAGATSHLGKPVIASTLLNAVREAIRKEDDSATGPEIETRAAS